MDNTEIKLGLDKIASSLKNLFKAQNLNEDGSAVLVKNTTATANDGTIMYFTESAIAVGVSVFSDEAMTVPTMDGIYSVDMNEVYVSAGVVTQIETMDSMKPKMAALENENNSLKTELENLKAEKSEIENLNKETVNELKVISDEFVALKKLIPNDVKIINSNSSNVVLTPAQLHIQNKNKFNV